MARKGDYHVRKNCCLSKSLQRKLLARESYREAVSSRLGHAEVGTTLNIYTKALRSADRACADTMSGILKKAEEKEGNSRSGVPKTVPKSNIIHLVHKRKTL